MRWRDILLWIPMLVVVAGVAVQLTAGPPWDEWALFAMSPLSATAIITYMVLENRHQKACAKP